MILLYLGVLLTYAPDANPRPFICWQSHRMVVTITSKDKTPPLIGKPQRVSIITSNLAMARAIRDYD